MPCDYKKYPVNWKELRNNILKRAENRCELCNAENYMPHWKTKAIVVLTVHHINFDIKDNRDYNLIALCQRCHNKLDIGQRVLNRKNNIKLNERGKK